MPKTPGWLAREASARAQAEREARFQYSHAIGPRWDDRLGTPAEYHERLARRVRREQELALRIAKPTSTAHFVAGRYEPNPSGRGSWCKHCGVGVTDRTLHDQFHTRTSPGAGVVMFLETLEALFGTTPEQ